MPNRQSTSSGMTGSTAHSATQSTIVSTVPSHRQESNNTTLSIPAIVAESAELDSMETPIEPHAPFQQLQQQRNSIDSGAALRSPMTKSSSALMARKYDSASHSRSGSGVSMIERSPSPSPMPTAVQVLTASTAAGATNHEDAGEVPADSEKRSPSQAPVLTPLAHDATLRETVISFVKQRYAMDKATIKLIVSLVVIFALSYYFMNVMANVASQRSKKIVHREALPDVFFDFLPEITIIELTDVFDFVMLIPTVIWILLSPAPLFLLVHGLAAWGVTNIMRTATVAITSLPDPRPGCEFVEGNVFTTFLLHRCGDCIFSGHTIIFVVTALVWTTYPPFLHRHIPGLVTIRQLVRNTVRSPAKRRQQLLDGEPAASEDVVELALSQKNKKLGLLVRFGLPLIMWLLCIAAALIVLANRAHYTVDVMLAFFITIGNWYTIKNFWLTVVKPSGIFPLVAQMSDRLDAAYMEHIHHHHRRY